MAICRVSRADIGRWSLRVPSTESDGREPLGLALALVSQPVSHDRLDQARRGHALLHTQRAVVFTRRKFGTWHRIASHPHGNMGCCTGPVSASFLFPLVRASSPRTLAYVVRMEDWREEYGFVGASV
jgi:hypothetical protein